MGHSRFVRAAALLAFLVLTLGVGFAAGMVTAPAVAGWYQTIAKPSFNPPSWVFAPVWTTLYLMIAVAAWRAWRVVGVSSIAMLLWFVQLALNFAWSFIFFGMHDIAHALIDVAALWIVILATLIAFFRIDRPAGWLFVPYLAWVSFAALLNWELFRLNGN